MGRDEAGIALYLVTGFLGAGKSTFMERLLRYEWDEGRRVGVLVNEIGAVSIDGTVLSHDGLDMVEVNDGSIFCPCRRDGFAAGLKAFLGLPLDVVLVEASGMADPFGMEDFLSLVEQQVAGSDGTTPTGYVYRGAVCIADVTSLADVTDVLESACNQVRKASVVLLNKIDLASADELAEAHDVIDLLNPQAFVYETTYGEIPLELLEEHLDPRGSSHGDTSNRCADRPANYALDLSEAHEPETVRAFMRALSKVAVRQKGFFRDAEGTLMQAQSVGGDVTVERFEPQVGEDVGLQLVAIGMDTHGFDDDLVGAWQRVFRSTPLRYEKG